MVAKIVEDGEIYSTRTCSSGCWCKTIWEFCIGPLSVYAVEPNRSYLTIGSDVKFVLQTYVSILRLVLPKYDSRCTKSLCSREFMWSEIFVSRTTSSFFVSPIHSPPFKLDDDELCGRVTTRHGIQRKSESITRRVKEKCFASSLSLLGGVSYFYRLRICM